MMNEYYSKQIIRRIFSDPAKKIELIEFLPTVEWYAVSILCPQVSSNKIICEWIGINMFLRF